MKYANLSQKYKRDVFQVLKRRINEILVRKFALPDERSPMLIPALSIEFLQLKGGFGEEALTWERNPINLMELKFVVKKTLFR